MTYRVGGSAGESASHGTAPPPGTATLGCRDLNPRINIARSRSSVALQHILRRVVALLHDPPATRSMTDRDPLGARLLAAESNFSTFSIQRDATAGSLGRADSQVATETIEVLGGVP
jgi:hypothetical protein